MSATYSLSPTDWQQIALRLFVSLLAGGIIGFDRELKNKPAGLRTNMLVSLGASFFVLVPIQLGAAQESVDALSRVIQGIITGVGFIGAGSILRESRKDSDRSKVRGLTSAAAVWVAAALGIAAGCGLWQLALIGAVLSFLVLRGLKRLEHSSIG